MTELLEAYAKVAGEDVIDHLRQLTASMRGMSVVHVNSTRVGGGVAEILHKLVPLMNELGVETRWEIITGGSDFYTCTKSMHNALQGNPIKIPERLLKIYQETNAHAADELRPVLKEADAVFIHDPQPAAIIQHIPDRKGKWVWRCHIDVSRPYRPVWRFLRNFVKGYDASIYSLAAFVQPLPHPQYLVPPSIDPLSEKNIDLEPEEVGAVFDRFNLDPDRPLLLQVSRFDRFKDPIGVIEGFRIAKRFMPHLQLVLAGGTATDDPEGEIVLSEVRNAAEDDPDIHILLLPADSHRDINALQRAATIVVQKSLREGFGLTVTEGLWKGKPVIGGDAGGIRLQVINYHTGFLVSTPEGMALRVRYLLQQPERLAEMGRKGQEFVRDNFLLTRQLREYLTLVLAVTRAAKERIELV